MRRIYTLVLASLLFLGSATTYAQSSMTDKEVMEYVMKALESGKDQKTIAMELARRGVTQEQALRVKAMYEQQGSFGMGAKSNNANQSRKRAINNGTDESEYIRGNFEFNDGNSDYSNSNYPYSGYRKNSDKNYQNYPNNAYNRNKGTNASSKNRNYQDRENSVVGNRLKGQNDRNTTSQDYDLSETLWDNEIMNFNASYNYKNNEKEIFGRNIFNSSTLTFEPSMNIATPKNYKLGPGDEVIVDIWGDNETTIRQEISPDGTINIESLGVIYLSGKTIAEANKYLEQELSKIYSGLNDDQSGNKMMLSLGQARTIQVNVMGEVLQPGTYTLSSFATTFHAIYRAGGVSEIGSLRKINLVRNGKKVSTIDIYDFIMNGTLESDICLQEGDVIIVPTYDELVEITGNVKRPMYYEMKQGETFAKLLKYCGGFDGNAYTKSIRVIRQNENENEICTITKSAFETFKLHNGDEINVEASLDRFSNKLEVKGAVYRPGLYQLGNIRTVKQLIAAADGIMGDAFLGRAVLQREDENKLRSIVQVDVKGILDGTSADIPLQKNDILYIPSIHDLEDMGTLTIHGEVARPGEYVYAQNMTLEDLVIQAGGLLESASTIRVDVARRIKDSKGENESNLISETFRFALKDGFVIDGQPGFILMPYDEVYVRQSPTYQKQQNVKIKGEILFPGDYALTRKNERLSDLIGKAGGVTSFAYTKGARLIRQMNEEEKARQESAIKMAKFSKDSISTQMLDINTQYSVGIDLELAMKKPGTDVDVVLRDGDLIEIPEFTNTVKISGAVMYPNVVSYIDGENIKYYISQAGGFGNEAKKRKAYVVYMNGQVKRSKSLRKAKIEPGCEIIVPVKPKNNWNVQQSMAVASGSASIATMIATIANLLK